MCKHTKLSPMPQDDIEDFDREFADYDRGYNSDGSNKSSDDDSNESGASQRRSHGFQHLATPSPARSGKHLKDIRRLLFRDIEGSGGWKNLVSGRFKRPPYPKLSVEQRKALTNKVHSLKKGDIYQYAAELQDLGIPALRSYPSKPPPGEATGKVRPAPKSAKPTMNENVLKMRGLRLSDSVFRDSNGEEVHNLFDCTHLQSLSS
jgi:hypothetical protein